MERENNNKECELRTKDKKWKELRHEIKGNRIMKWKRLLFSWYEFKDKDMGIWRENNKISRFQTVNMMMDGWSLIVDLFLNHYKMSREINSIFMSTLIHR